VTTSLWLSGLQGASKFQFLGREWSAYSRNALHEALIKPFRAHKGAVADGAKTLFTVSFFRLVRASKSRASEDERLKREAAKLLYRCYTGYTD